MAVAFDAVGPSSAGAGSGGTANLSWTHTVGSGISNTILLVSYAWDGATDGAITVTCQVDSSSTGVVSLGRVESDSQANGFLQVWAVTGAGAAPGAHTVTVTPSATPNDHEGGSLSFSGAKGTGTPVTAQGTSASSSASVTASSASFIAAFTAVGDTIVSSGNTSRFIKNQVGGAGNAVGNIAGSTAAGTGSPVTMSWTLTASGDPWAVLAVEVTPAPPVASNPYIVLPGRTWMRNFRKPQYFNQQPPGPVITQANPVTATATGTALNPAVITVSAAAAPQFNPGRTWRKHFQWPQQQQLSGPPPLAFATAGLATATGTAFGTPPPFIATLTPAASGHFTDQYSNPRLFYSAVPWGMPANAGRWNSGNWQSDFDTYFADIAAIGMTAAEMHPWGHSHTGCNNDLGNTWDGVAPFTTLPTLNDTFWQRIDYLLDSALAQGITVLLVLNMQCDMGVDAFAGTGVFNGVSAANLQTACQNIAARYASQPNLIFFQGDDYNNDDDTRMQAMVDGLHAGGYTGPTGTEEYSSGTTSRRDLSGSPTGTPFTFGGANSTFNWCYYYAQTYFAVEFAYQENNQIPVLWGDGFYVGGGAGEPADTHLMRNFVWWALSSGARGCSMGSESILQWQSTAFTDLTVTQKWYVNEALPVYTAFTALTGWWNLLPDLANALVIKGRGTRSGYSASNFQAANLGTDNYVSASRTPDGSLAVIYCAVAMSITIDTTKLGAGFTATWIDPTNGATQTATPGATFSSGPLGNNAAGDPDWVLALQGPAVVTLPQPYAQPGQTWLRRFRHAQQVVPPAPAPAAFVNAPAGLASATGTALGQDTGADIAMVSPNAGLPAATGTSLGQDTGADIASVAPNAGLPAATGTALGQDQGADIASVSVNAGLASASGAAVGPGVQVVLPQSPAYPGAVWRHYFKHPQQPATFAVPAPATNVSAGLASATGTALGQDTGADLASVAPNSTLAGSSGAALSATDSLATNGGTATATGSGQQPGPSIAIGAAVAVSSGTSQQPVPSVAPSAGLATGTGAALDATVTTVSGPTALPVPQVLPGRTWLRQFRHLQQPLPPPPFVAPAFQVARSTPTAGDPNDGTATVSDPRDGTASVLVGATSAASVS